MKPFLMISSALFSVIVFASFGAYALPRCPVNPGSQFQFPANLFDSAVTGVSTLRAIADCRGLNLPAGTMLELFASEQEFSLRSENVPVIKIEVPSEGDYVTSDTCQSVTISSNEIRSPAFGLDIFETTNGLVTVTHGADHCEFKICPKFGPCD